MAELLDELIPAPACRTGRAAQMLVAMVVVRAQPISCNPNGKIERRLLPAVAP